MAFSKQKHLKQNIEALRIAFTLEKNKRQAAETERQQLLQYSGFGGLKFVLNPIETPGAINQWVKSEQDLFPLTRQLHQLLRENATDDKQYYRYVESMRGSVLTAFYTPPAIIDSIAATLRDRGISIQRFLEPSAGIGSFIQSFADNRTQHVAAYEKDLLSGKVLKQLYQDRNIRVSGFEEIPEHEQSSYDIIASNIPFGDTSVFDLSFSRSKDTARVQAARSIHNYFFLKGTDMLRDGGILAFITSRGLLNSSKNEPIRRALMKDNNLVSAVRLPNNLFADYAGTEVGSDLIILQKHIGKGALSEAEERFCQTYTISENITNNVLFENLGRIVHTSLYRDTDMYGKPAWIYEHEGGVKGIAQDLKQMLTDDFSSRLDIRLHNGQRKNEAAIQIPEVPQAIQPPIIQQSHTVVIKSEPHNLFSSTDTDTAAERVQLSLFDLYLGEVQAVAVASSSGTTTTAKKQAIARKRSITNRQADLFSSAAQQPFAPLANTVPAGGKKPAIENKQATIGDLFSGLNVNDQIKPAEAVNILPEPALYTGLIQSFHRNDSLAIDKGLVRL